ncbi:importin subunit beta-3 [Diutina catenulata]
MSVLPGDVHASLSRLMTQLASADNTHRKSGEEELEKTWQKDPQQAAMLLTFLAEKAAQGDAFAAVLFRRVGIRMPEYSKDVSDRTMASIPEPVRAQIREVLLAGFSAPGQSVSVRHKLGDALAEMARADASPQGSWPQLLPALVEAARAPNSEMRESAFRVVAATPELLEQLPLEQVVALYKAGFDDASDDVRIAACTAFVAFFRGLPRTKWSSLSVLLPNLLNSLPRLLEARQEAALAQVFESLIELVELAPKMFKEMFPTMVAFCKAVCDDKELDDACRMAALELLTEFAEMAPGMCKRSDTFTATTVVICLSMLTEVCEDDDDASEWNNTSANDDDGDDDPVYDAARQALDRISLKLTGQAVAPPLFQYLPEMVASKEWRQRQAALMAISSAAEGCVDVLLDQIDTVLDLVLPLATDPHPRVQYACCNALGQMSTDFSDVVQRGYGNRILPPLIAHLTSKSVPRVQAHAAAALVNFSEAAPKEVLEPYLDSLLTNLLGLLQNSPKRYVQEQVLTTIAIIADAAQNYFSKYYDTLMPLLLDVLHTSADGDDQMRSLQAKCIECSTLIAVAVGKEQFSQHTTQLIQVFAQLQGTVAGDDDPIKSFLEQGWCRICGIVGSEFLPLLPEVLPPLLEMARASQDVSLLDDDQAEDYSANDEWDVINLSGKLIAVHTSTLDDKVAALDLLRTYGSQLRGDFYPYVGEIVSEIAMPALSFYLHDGVRASAALTLASMVRCAVAANQGVAQLWAQVAAKLTQVLVSEPLPELLMAYYTALLDMVNVVPSQLLSESPVLSDLATAINTNLHSIYERIKTRENGDDEEYTEDVADSDEEYTDEELLDECNKLVSVLFRKVPAAFLPPFFQVARDTVTLFLAEENTHLKLCGMCLVCDVLETGGVDAKDWLYTVGESLTSAHAGIRQAASYAVGTAAKNPANKQFCLACLEPLFKMASVPDAGADENVHATENGTAAIARICSAFHADVPHLDSILKEWVGLLPVVQDEQIAPTVYQFLTQLITSGHPAVTEQAAKVVDGVVPALVHHSLSDAQAQPVVAAVRQLLTQMPQDQAMALLQKYPVEVVKKWFS